MATMNTNDHKAIAADNLFAALTKNFPAPWHICFHKPDRTGATPVSEIVATNGTQVVTIETHTGDGDRFNLGDDGAKALVEFVNVMNW